MVCKLGLGRLHRRRCLSDRFGRRGILLLSSILFLISTVVCTVAATLPVLVAGPDNGAAVHRRIESTIQQEASSFGQLFPSRMRRVLLMGVLLPMF